MNEWLFSLPSRGMAALLVVRGAWALYRDFRRWEKELTARAAWIGGEVRVTEKTRERLSA